MNAEEYASRISRIETVWTLVRDAHAEGAAQLAQSQEALLHRYTGPIYRYAGAGVDRVELACLLLGRHVRRRAERVRGKTREIPNSRLSRASPLI